MSVNERSTEEVFLDHLKKRKERAREEDILEDYARDAIFLTSLGVLRGHDGARYLVRRFENRLPMANIDYNTKLVFADVAFLEWTADSHHAVVRDGAESFQIRGGKIVIHTIHYTVVPVRKKTTERAEDKVIEFDSRRR